MIKYESSKVFEKLVKNYFYKFRITVTISILDLENNILNEHIFKKKNQVYHKYGFLLKKKKKLSRTVHARTKRVKL